MQDSPWVYRTTGYGGRCSRLLLGAIDRSRQKKTKSKVYMVHHPTALNHANRPLPCHQQQIKSSRAHVRIAKGLGINAQKDHRRMETSDPDDDNSLMTSLPRALQSAPPKGEKIGKSSALLRAEAVSSHDSCKLALQCPEKSLPSLLRSHTHDSPAPLVLDMASDLYPSSQKVAVGCVTPF